jgi:phenol hydroxylase P0 protein
MIESVNSKLKDIATLTHYVHVTGVLKNEFVEFDFSIGDPNLYVELVLPFLQFKSFCKKYNVEELTLEQEKALALDKLKWRYGNFK